MKGASVENHTASPGNGVLLQPMAVAGIGGMPLKIPVAMFPVPCLHVAQARGAPVEAFESVPLAEEGALK